MKLDSNTHQDIPKQKIPNSKKTKKWGEQCIEAYISLSDIGGFGSRRSDIQVLYDFYNGHILEDDYHYVLKPYGKARRNFPSKIRNYPIIKPVVDLLLGEKSKRPLNYTVTVANADSVSIKEEQKKQLIMQAMQQKFVNQLNQTEGAPPTGSPSQEVEMPEHIAKMFDASYVDQRAMIGQSSISYLMYKNHIYDKFNKIWFHFLVSGEAYTHRGVRNGDPFYDIINPLDIDYDKDPDVDLIEDGDWALIRKDAHVSTIVDAFREHLTDAEIDKLESPDMNDGSFLIHSVNPSGSLGGNRSRLIEVITVYWKSISRVGFLTYPDPMTGDIETLEVPDGYKLPSELKKQGAVLDWGWIPEVWEGSRIGEDLYVKIGKIEMQRRSMDNPSVCKLPVNGIKYSETNTENVSLVKLGVPYQINYNIYKYRLEVAIAKSKDIIAQFDINMIPKKWDMDKFMYYIDATGIAWVDYNKEGIVLNPQHQTVMDLSIKTIEQYVVLLESILQEWERLSGVNRQRQGAIGQYEGKGTSQQAIMQSSHITEDYFRKMSMLEQSDLQAMLDYSKLAWVGGKKTSYVMPDGAIEFLSVDPLKHMESEYGIFISDAGQDIEKKQKVEMLAQAMIQNGVPASIVAEAIDKDSFTQIKEKIAEAEKTAQELAQAQQQAEMQQKQQQMELQQQKMEYDADQAEKNRQTQIEVAMINAEANDDIQRMKLGLESVDIKRQALSDKDNIKVDREKIAADIKMNTEDNETDIKINNDDNKVEEKKISAMVKAKKDAPNK